MESNDLDKLFRDAFEQSEETPNDSVWSGIEQALEKEKKVIPFYIKHRTSISIAAMFLLFFGLGINYYNQQTFSPTEKIDEIIASVENREIVPPTEVESEKDVDIKIEKQHKDSSKESMLAQKQPAQSEVRNEVSSQIKQPTTRVGNSSREIVIEKIEIPDTKNLIAAADVTIQNNTISYDESEEIINPIEEDSRYTTAYSTPRKEVKSSLITKVLNRIAKNIISNNLDVENKREIEFKNDEEGSITINILNSLARK